MQTSGTYNFNNVQNSNLYDYAYKLIDIEPGILTPNDIYYAQQIANFILSSWANQSLNLWTIEQNALLTLIPNKATYSLPSHAIDILEACLKTSTRVLGGTAISSSGNAQNAFDGNPETSCSANGPNAYIGYDYGSSNAAKTIQIIGIKSNTASSYTISIQVSSDGINWSTIQSIPETSYSAGELIWFSIKTPVQYRFYRILETTSKTMDIQELYFNNNVFDFVMSPCSRSDYMSYPNKLIQGRPIQYHTSRLTSPTITIWPVPSPMYMTLSYNYKRTIQDIGTLTNTPDIPERFFEALALGIASRLSITKKPDLYNVLTNEYRSALNMAFSEDMEKYINFELSFDMSGNSL